MRSTVIRLARFLWPLLWLVVLLALVLYTAARAEAEQGRLIVSWTQGPTAVYPGDEVSFVVHAYRWPEREDLRLSPAERLERRARAYQPDWSWPVTVTLALPEGFRVLEAEGPKLGWCGARVGPTPARPGPHRPGTPITERRWPIRLQEQVAKYRPRQEREGIEVPLGVMKPGDHTIITLRAAYWPRAKSKPKPAEEALPDAPEVEKPKMGSEVAGK